MKRYALLFICLLLIQFNANYTLGFSIYYTEANQGINRVNSDGTNNLLLVPEPSLWIFQKIDIDKINRRIYWTDTYADVIQRANMDGSNVETIYTAPELHGCFDVAIDSDNGKMYWSDNSNIDEHTTHPIIYRANLDGSDIQPAIYGTGTAWDIDLVDGKIYWNEYTEFANGTAESFLKRSNIDGSNKEILYARNTNILIFGDQGVFNGLDVDERNTTIYWSERYPDRYVIKKSNSDGSLIEDIIITDETIFGVAVDYLNDELYWQRLGIYKSDLDGNNIQQIFNCGHSYDLSLDITYVPTIDAILTFFDDSVADGSLTGDGPGNSADGRLNALRNMLEMAGDLIYANDIEGACGQLEAALDKCDGESPPPDFATGPAATELYAMISDLMAELECE